MNKAILSKDYSFPSGKYKEKGIFRCYGEEVFEEFCKKNMKDGFDMDAVWKDFFVRHSNTGGAEYEIPALHAKDHKTHTISFDTTYVFRNVKCMDVGDCSTIVVEF